MALDLKTHQKDIVSAWEDVSSASSKTTWAVFGYEGQTGVLKVVEKGDGEFDEMVENLNSGKIQYAYCRVTDPNTKLPKFVLVNWQGDGAPDTWKGRCASHVKQVAALLRGAHLTINARDESDLDMDDVLKQVAKSSGAQYSFHKEAPKKYDEPTGPVGSVYKKVKPQAEIDINKRDQFWSKAEMEEKKRRENEMEDRMLAQKKIEQERREREKLEAQEREKKIQEHSREVAQLKQAEKAADTSKASGMSSQQMEADAARDEDERRNRSESLRKQRAAEAASLVKQRENNPREMFKQRERALSQEERAPPPTAPKKLPKTFPFQQQQQHQEDEAPPPVRRHREPSPPPREPSPPPREPSPPPREPSPPPREPSPPPREPSPPPREPSPPCMPSQPVSMMSRGLPPRPDSDEEDEEQDWDAPTQDDQYQPNIDPYQQKDEPDVMGEGGVKARAIYDYEATAEDEISFDPGDLIAEIEQVDDGWWIGTAPNGHRGLFPANYVELI